MRLAIAMIVMLAGCTVPTEPSATPPEEPSEAESEERSAPLTVVGPAAGIDLQVWSDGWNESAIIENRVDVNVTGGLLRLDAASVAVRLRVLSDTPSTVFGWHDGCCSYNPAGPWTVEPNGTLDVEMPPGRWHLEARDEHGFAQDSLTLDIHNAWRVSGEVLPLPVDAPDTQEVDEIRIDKDGLAGTVTLDLRAEGEVRDVRLGVLQGNWIECGPEPRPGQLSMEDQFMETYMQEDLDTFRVLVGAIDSCTSTLETQLNADTARYVLTIRM